MVAFYVRKIQTQQINSKTGVLWTLEDVPARWHDAVAVVLNDVN